MNILLAIIFLGLSSWTLVALPRRLRRERAGAAWWTALAFLSACGLALGAWCAFKCEYRVGSQFRFGSFPIPVVVFHLEGGGQAGAGTLIAEGQVLTHAHTRDSRSN